MLRDLKDDGVIFAKSEKVRKTTYKEQAYKLIREAILYQRLKAGKIYSQEALCEELGASRTPIREALLELQKEGYLVFCRGKGIKIVSLDQEAIREILEARLYLERITAKLAAERADKEDMRYIEACLLSEHEDLIIHREKNDMAKSYQLDHQFHRAVAKASHNRQIYNMLDNILNMYLRFETQTVYHNASSANSILEEHDAIFHSVANHEAEKAEEAAEHHLLRAYRRTLKEYWKE